MRILWLVWDHTLEEAVNCEERRRHASKERKIEQGSINFKRICGQSLEVRIHINRNQQIIID